MLVSHVHLYFQRVIVGIFPSYCYILYPNMNLPEHVSAEYLKTCTQHMHTHSGLYEWVIQRSPTNKVIHNILDQMSDYRIRHSNHHQCGHDQVQDGFGQRDGVPGRRSVVREQQIVLRVRILKDALHARGLVGVWRRVTGAHCPVRLQRCHDRGGHSLRFIQADQARGFIHQRQDLRQEIAPVLNGTRVAQIHTFFHVDSEGRADFTEEKSTRHKPKPLNGSTLEERLSGVFLIIQQISAVDEHTKS